MTISVLGLGAMGLPMATNLAENFGVCAYDVSAERTAAARDAGLATAASAKECVSGAEVVLIALRNKEQLRSLLFGEAGISDALAEGALIILTSTVGIEAVKAVGAELAKLGIGLIDAPVSGGPVRAGTGDLLVVVGAEPTTYSKALPVLEKMSSTLVNVGDEPGKGQAMKTVNQLLCGVHVAAAGEALALAESLGLDLSQALEALMSGAASSFMLGDRGPRMIQAMQGDTPPVKSRLDIFTKDMNIVTSAAKHASVPTPVAAAAEQAYLLGANRGLNASDDSQVVTVFQPH